RDLYVTGVQTCALPISRGFWRPGSTARKGVSAALGISIGLGKGERGRGRGDAGAPPELPPAAPPTTITGNAVDVVQTALESLGRSEERRVGKECRHRRP